LISEYLDAAETVLKKRSFTLSLVFSMTVILGTLNILFSGHTSLKLAHLLAAHLIWIGLMMFWHALRYQQHRRGA